MHDVYNRTIIVTVEGVRVKSWTVSCICRPKPKAPPVAAKPSTVAKCMMCTTEPVGVTFRPCGHSVACIECSSRMKQCFSCHEGIQEKVRLPKPSPAAAAAAAKCLMCMSEPVGMTFRPCGHSVACVECSTRMQKCFSCHEPIQAILRHFAGTPGPGKRVTSGVGARNLRLKGPIVFWEGPLYFYLSSHSSSIYST